MSVDRVSIEAAARRIDARVRHTPVIELREQPDLGVRGVFLKLELLQHTGSFKARGAFNRMLSADIPAAGVIAASGGNHGAAVAWAARELGIAAEIFVPRTTPEAKVSRLRNYGGRVTQTGEDYAQAYEAMRARAADSGALVVHAYDDAAVVAGQGTVARELQDQAASVDAVFVAVGGGGLIAGVAGWYAGAARVIAVEPETCPTLHHAMLAGRPVDVEVSGVAADSLGARRIGSIAFDIAQRHVAGRLVVSDEQILRARKWLWENLRVAAEPGGAAALAGLLSGNHGLAPESRVAVIVCGGNSDPATLAQ